MKKDGANANAQRNHDQWNTQSVADPVYRILVTTGVLRDPLFVTASA
jgi:hypothetical protein